MGESRDGDEHVDTYGMAFLGKHDQWINGFNLLVSFMFRYSFVPSISLLSFQVPTLVHLKAFSDG
jgi:hypothetical protein